MDCSSPEPEKRLILKEEILKVGKNKKQKPAPNCLLRCFFSLYNSKSQEDFETLLR